MMKKYALPILQVFILLATCVGVFSLAHALNNQASAPYVSRSISCTILLDLAVKPVDLPPSCHDQRVLAHYDINQLPSVSRTTSQHLVCALFTAEKFPVPEQCLDLGPIPAP